MEEKLRLSSGIQYEFEKAEDSYSPIDWMDVVSELQYKIAREFVEEDKVDIFVHAMRITPADVHWKKYNRAGRGNFPLNNPARDCILWNVNKNGYTSLSNELATNLTVVIAGSIS